MFEVANCDFKFSCSSFKVANCDLGESSLEVANCDFKIFSSLDIANCDVNFSGSSFLYTIQPRQVAVKNYLLAADDLDEVFYILQRLQWSGLNFFYVLLLCHSLHHNIHNSSGDDDDFLGRVAGEIFGCVFVCKNKFLHFFFRGVLRALERETHLAVELNRVLLRILYQIRLIALRPFGVYDE